MVIVEVETIVIHQFNFAVPVHDLSLWDEVERPQQMHYFLEYNRFCRSIW